MASIEVSLPVTPRRKKGSSVSGGLASSGHRNREHYRELDSLRVALRDKENIIQTLKGQLCNTLSNRLAMRNGAPPLTEADKRASEERLHRLKRDADNKRLVIKNLKLALDRLDITDNIDVRIQQAELEYRLGREELELLTLKEETRTLQAAIELAESQEKQKSDTVYSCITGSAQITIHAVEVSADPKSPRFGAGPREDTPGLFVDWAIEDSGLCKGDRILEVNGKLVVSAGRNDLTRLLAVAPDAAQVVVLRRNDSLATLRNLRSDNLRLTHRIGYLEEQVRDLLAPTTEAPVQSSADDGSSRHPHKERPQVFQKGPQVTALVSGLPGLNLGSPDSRRGLSSSKVVEALSAPRNRTSSRHKHHQQQQQQLQSAKSSASLDLVQPQPRYDSSMLSSPRRRTPRTDDHHHHHHRTRRQLLSSLEFDSDTAYHRLQQQQQGGGEQQANSSTETNSSTSQQQARHEAGIGIRSRPAPPKKPLRLSLHRATSLQSVESAPAAPVSSGCSSPLGRKPTKRNHRGDPEPPSSAASLCSVVLGGSGAPGGRSSPSSLSSTQQQERAPSRAESCQSALRWPSPKSCTARAHLARVSVEKWC